MQGWGSVDRRRHRKVQKLIFDVENLKHDKELFTEWV